MRSEKNHLNIKLIIIYTIFYALMVYLFNYFIFTEDFYLRNLSKDYSFERIESMIKQSKRLVIYSYLSIPLIIIIKVYTIAFILYVGVFFSDYKLKLYQFIEIILYAEAVFLVQVVIKFGYILIAGTSEITLYNMNSLLSLNQVFDAGRIPSYLQYSSNTINIFEVVYFVAICYMISKKFHSTFKYATLYVVKTYLPALTIWVLLVTFLQLEFL